MATPPPLKMARTCSQCGNNGHNSRTCTEQTVVNTTTATTTTTTNNNNGVMLFGVRLTPMENTCSPCLPATSTSSFRKCMSMNNLAQYEQQDEQQFQQQSPRDSGYASDDAIHDSGNRNRERKRGVPWTVEEHRLFLMGLNQVGKGDWRGISRNFVKTRTPTQVASHAQKYFLRRTNLNRRRRRSSLFDITTDSMSRSASADHLHNLDTTFQPKQGANQPTLFSSPCPPTMAPDSPDRAHATLLAPAPPSSKMAKLNLNQSPKISPTSSTSTASTTREREFKPFISLRLSRAPSDDELSPRSNAFGGFSESGDSIISVA